jgi:hypothetical protein
MTSEPGPARGHHGLWACGAVAGIAFLCFGFIVPGEGSATFFVLLALAAAGYFAALRLIANGLRLSGSALIVCAALGLAWRIPLLLAPPERDADVRRYVWDARLVRAGLSPWSVVPADPAFAHLRTAESWPVNNADVPSPYPPGAQLFFLAATTPAESTRALKVAALICEALLALVVWRWLVAAGANPGWLIAVLWSPLASLEVARHGHVDVAGALCLALAAFAFVRGRALLGSLAFAMAVAVKPLPIVLLPLLWRRVPARYLLAGLAALVALYLPFWEHGHLPLGSMPDVVDRFRFNGPIFAGLAQLAGSAAAAAFTIAAGLAVAARARRRLPLASPQAWAWPMAAALLCAPLAYPWYLLWLAPFLATPETLPLTIWTASILTTYTAWLRQGVTWGAPGWAVLVEYGAVAFGAAWLWPSRGERALKTSEP